MRNFWAKLILLAIVAFAFTLPAWAAANLTITGDYEVQGKQWKNQTFLGADPADKIVSYGFYEQELNLYPKLSLGATFVEMKLATHDVTWGKDYHAYPTGSTETGEHDFNLAVERCYLQHAFSKTLFIKAGLMDDGAWSTSFGNDNEGSYKVMVGHMWKYGFIGGQINKYKEIGDATTDDLDKDDRDGYIAYAITKLGGISIEPLIGYIVYSDFPNALGGPVGYDTDGLKVMVAYCGFRGEVAGLGFEAEVDYKDYKCDWKNTVDPYYMVAGKNAAVDYALYGFYLNAWKQLDTAKVGAILAYGSYDADAIWGAGAGFDFEDDFDSTLILGDDYVFGDTGSWSTTEDDLVGMTLIKLYANIAATDKITISPSAAYIISNQEKSTKYGDTTELLEEATAYEFDLEGSYKITDNLSYTIGGGYAKVDLAKVATSGVIDDPDPAYLLFHKLNFNF